MVSALNMLARAMTYMMVTDIDGRYLIYYPQSLHNKNSFDAPRLQASAGLAINACLIELSSTQTLTVGHSKTPDGFHSSRLLSRIEGSCGT